MVNKRRWDERGHTLWSTGATILLLDRIHHLWDVVSASPPGLLLCIKISLSSVLLLLPRHYEGRSIDHH